ncbi:acetyl-CoA carboxylase biotin carboxyl carrier protein subunit [Aquimarina sp. U1-2]|uniref:acetyl-CoA carboxylase biotin carboxyl carrier protein subunit n=1 Tax=Aquimarina sp. U1-2 TaxID=2823141 RepID=UPI001AEC827F|nr:acetyl-CoA carboxylase biotin carboxyl carrier protein subunit [Aquimarina sp. U1-2]MBP2834035.1 acetyl-CoA carboxylase biotin carboxyl carrier protein subunit [Aquimarina sp. U1-2]
MSEKYKIQVNETFEFDLTHADTSTMDTIQTSENTYHTLLEDTSYHTEVVQKNFNTKEYIVKVNNNHFKVNIADELDVRIAAMGFSLGSSKQINAIKAPMPGLLLDIHVTVDQEVKENDPLLILEAMKMENVILSPRDGVIKSIHASKGDAVDKGQLLIEFQ